MARTTFSTLLNEGRSHEANWVEPAPEAEEWAESRPCKFRLLKLIDTEDGAGVVTTDEAIVLYLRALNTDLADQALALKLMVEIRLIAPPRMAEQLLCGPTGEGVDRDINAAKNLRDWPETQASSGLVEASAPVDTRAASDGGTDLGSDRGMTRDRRSDHKTYPSGEASRGEARTEPDDRQAKNLERGAAA